MEPHIALVAYTPVELQRNLNVLQEPLQKHDETRRGNALQSDELKDSGNSRHFVFQRQHNYRLQLLKPLMWLIFVIRFAFAISAD